jgi:hypothetical protein
MADCALLVRLRLAHYCRQPPTALGVAELEAFLVRSEAVGREME